MTQTYKLCIKDEAVVRWCPYLYMYIHLHPHIPLKYRRKCYCYKLCPLPSNESVVLRFSLVSLKCMPFSEERILVHIPNKLWKTFVYYFCVNF